MKNSQIEKKKEKDKDKDKEKEQIKIPQLPYDFNISNTIVKYIIEKIISLTVTLSLHNKINNQIPSFCFDEIKNSLSLALCIDFINYDKDDIKPKKTLLDFISKSSRDVLKIKKEKKLIKNNSENLRKYIFGPDLDPNVSYEGSINLNVFNDTPMKENQDNKDLYKGLAMPSNKRNFFLKYIPEEKKEEENKSTKDPNLSTLLNGLIIREKTVKTNILDFQLNSVKKERKSVNSNDNNENDNLNIKDINKVPFEVKDIEKIEKIKNIDSHGIDMLPMFFSSNKENNILNNIFSSRQNNLINSWSLIPQPKVPPIDRDAGTKINFIKNISKFRKTKTLTHPPPDLVKQTSDQKKEISSSIKDSKNSIKSKNKIINFSYKKPFDTNENNTRKKKYAPLIEFPSEDIDPKTLGRDTESEELKKLRENLEKELIEKKLEQIRKIQKEREIQALEKAREEKRKELANKNVTVDIKGDIVYIKSLNINDFANDFTKMRSKFKEIQTIQSESKTSLIQKATVEKNPVNFFDLIDKEKPKKKMKKNYFGIKSAKNDKQQQNKIIWIGDRVKDPIIAAGSNFEIMSPECGVSLKEDEKTKFGGKDFFRKYNKYSLEVFEETLNKTNSSNFYSGKRNSFFNTNPNNNITNNTTTNISNSVNKNLKKLKSKKFKDENKSSIEGNNTNNKKNNLNIILPNEANDKILVKAKNLKMALNNLDLITEHDEKYYSEKKKNKNSNIIKKNKYFDFLNKNRNEYDEINKFAKTLVGSDNWGDNLLHQKKPEMNFKKPQKPQNIELKRELPLNLLNHLPRKRLPPINMYNRMNNNFTMGYTLTDGFFGRKKKMRIFLSEENNKKEEKNKKEESNDNNAKNEEKDNVKDKFNFTSTSGFLQKQLDE